MSEKLRLTYEQLAYIVEQTGVQDPKKAIEYFAEVMILEKVHPSKMSACVSKMMEKDRKKLK